MEVKQVDPYKINVDEMNERKENLNLTDLEASIEEQGVIQPPLVRPHENGEIDYTVVVGQRRVLASQSVGIDQIPIVVVNWNDKEALDASVTENINSFREDVSPPDRAMAVERRLQWEDIDTQKELAQTWGVHKRDISRWLERVRDEWEGTLIDPNVVDDTMEDDVNVQKKIEEMDDDTLANIRQSTGGGKEGEELVKKAAKHDLTREDMRELTKRVERGKDVESALAKTIEEKHSTGDIKVNANVTFSGDNAGAIQKAATDRGMTENEVVREAIQNYLSREGYL